MACLRVEGMLACAREAARAPPRRPPPPVGSATLPSATQPLELAPVVGQVREYEALDADCPDWLDGGAINVLDALYNP